jgi:hypothetical protein
MSESTSVYLRSVEIIGGDPVAAEHPFRFGVVAAQARSGKEWTDKVRRIESMGYSTLLMPDDCATALHRCPRWRPPPQSPARCGWVHM